MTVQQILPAATVVTRGTNGAIYARCPHPLGPYPARITERLEHWAGRAPDRPFLARRDREGAWREITYANALRQVRSIAQAILDRRLSADRPIVILSGNSIEHALLALAAMYVGVPYAPIAPSYSLLARDHTTLKGIWAGMRPGLVFAAEGSRFARALDAVRTPEVEVVSCEPAGTPAATCFGELEATRPTGDVDDAHRRVGAGTVAKILYTSGSTGRPKGVINTQRMLCANQEMLRTVLPCLGSAPVLCDWLPWNHTFGGNHNFGIVLYNGGTLYIDDGKPTPDGFATTLWNLREVATTAYFNVPRGYDLLVPQLRADAELRARFFSRLGMLFSAAAALRQRVADELGALAREASRGRVPLVTGLGATESAPFALCAGDADFSGGRVGVPVPGVELKLAPAGERFEARLRGPSITPGYWRDAALTTAAFDDEGYYRLGDALSFVDPEDPARGFVFEGRLAEDFKLSTGTWVRVGPLRQAVLARLGDLAQDVVIAGHDRDFVGALIFPAAGRRQAIGEAAFTRQLREDLQAFAAAYPASSTAIRRAVVLEEPPSIDAQEVTEKGSVNQKAVLASRASLLDDLYGDHPSEKVLIIGD